MKGSYGGHGGGGEQLLGAEGGCRVEIYHGHCQCMTPVVELEMLVY